MATPRRLYWDLTHLGRDYPDGIGRFAVALAARAYALPSVYLLPPYLDGGGLHRALAGCPGEVVIAHRHPKRRTPWRRRWDQALDEPGILFAPGNVHRPCRWPTIVVVHDLIPYEHPDYRRFAHRSPRAYGAMLRSAAAVATVSRTTADALTRRYPDVRVAAIVTQGLFDPPEPRRPAWAPDAPFDLFVGGAEPRKRLEDAVALAAALADAPLVVVGRDWGERRVADLVAPLGARALSAARCDDGELAWLYARCRALLYPSRLEGFGLPPLEALRARRPAVAGRVSCLPEVLGEQALWHDFTRPAGDVAALRAALAAWTPRADLDAHLARFDWTRARDTVATLVDGVLACASR